MHADVMSLFRELADCSAAEREACYEQRQVPAAIRAEVESLCDSTGCQDQARAITLLRQRNERC